MKEIELSRAVPYLWGLCDSEEAKPALITVDGRVIAVVTPITAEASLRIPPADPEEHADQNALAQIGVQPYDKQAALDFLRSLRNVSDEEAAYNAETLEILKKAMPRHFPPEEIAST